MKTLIKNLSKISLILTTVIVSSAIYATETNLNSPIRLAADTAASTGIGGGTGVTNPNVPANVNPSNPKPGVNSNSSTHDTPIGTGVNPAIQVNPNSGITTTKMPKKNNSDTYINPNTN
ncbi:hypothetical protein BH10PSE19_BH10PSE19_15920 [soil metagenome]